MHLHSNMQKSFFVNANEDWNKCSAFNLIYEKPQLAAGQQRMSYWRFLFM